MRAVNLLPAPRVDKRPERRPRAVLRTTKAIAVAAGARARAGRGRSSGSPSRRRRSDVSDRQATLEGLEAEVAQSQAAASVSAAVAAQTQAHLAAVTAAASGRTAWDGLLDQLSRVMPRGRLARERADDAGCGVSRAHVGIELEHRQRSRDVERPEPVDVARPPRRGRSRSRASRARRAVVPRVLERLALIPALVRRVAPVDAAGRWSPARRQCNSRSTPTCVRQEGSADEGQVDTKGRRCAGRGCTRGVALIGWFGLVSPQRSKAAELDQQIADAQTQLVVLKATTRRRPARHERPSDARAHARDAAERGDAAGAAAAPARREPRRRAARLRHAAACYRAERATRRCRWTSSSPDATSRSSGSCIACARRRGVVGDHVQRPPVGSSASTR